MTVYRTVATRKKVVNIPYMAVALFLILNGCAPVISKELRSQVAREITFKEILKDPEAYKGKVVLWGA